MAVQSQLAFFRLLSQNESNTVFGANLIKMAPYDWIKDCTETIAFSVDAEKNVRIGEENRKNN